MVHVPVVAHWVLPSMSGILWGNKCFYSKCCGQIEWDGESRNTGKTGKKGGLTDGM